MAFHIHAGGAASHPLLDPCSNSLLLAKQVVSRFSELDITQIGSLVAIAGLLPTAWRFLRQQMRDAVIDRQFQHLRIDHDQPALIGPQH